MIWNMGEDGVLKEHFKGINRGRLLAFCRRNGISENVVFLTAFNYSIGLFSNEKRYCKHQYPQWKNGQQMESSGGTIIPYLLFPLHPESG